MRTVIALTCVCIAVSTPAPAFVFVKPGTDIGRLQAEVREHERWSGLAAEYDAMIGRAGDQIKATDRLIERIDEYQRQRVEMKELGICARLGSYGDSVRDKVRFIFPDKDTDETSAIAQQVIDRKRETCNVTN